MWNDLPNTVFDTGTLDGFKGASIVRCFPEFVFQFFHGAVVGLRKQFKTIIIKTSAAGFNNNNNISL